MLLLTLIILVILPVCTNASPGATSEAERQEARAFYVRGREETKECCGFQIERRIVFGGRNDAFIWHLRGRRVTAAVQGDE